MPRERNVSEEERLNRIERHINQLAEASAALKEELVLARQLAQKRALATRPHVPASQPDSSKRPKRNNGPQSGFRALGKVIETSEEKPPTVARKPRKRAAE